MSDSECPGQMQAHTSLCIVHHPDGLFLPFIKSVLIIFIHISLDSLVTKIYKYWLYNLGPNQQLIGYFKACVYIRGGVMGSSGKTLSTLLKSFQSVPKR